MLLSQRYQLTDSHVAALRLRMWDTVWVFRDLRTVGFTETELAIVYGTVIRPILYYLLRDKLNYLSSPIVETKDETSHKKYKVFMELIAVSLVV